MIVVIGPPGSGKSTYVRERVRFGEMVVDVDELFRAVTLRPMWEKPPQLIGAVLSVRDYLIENYEPEWVISTNAGLDYREGMRERFGAEVVVMETPAYMCLERIEADGRPWAGNDWEGLVAGWWEAYERDERDEVISPLPSPLPQGEGAGGDDERD